MKLSSGKKKPNLVAKEFADLLLTNTGDARTSSVCCVEVKPDQTYTLQATLVDGSGSVHLGYDPPYNDIFSTYALRPNNKVQKTFKPKLNKIYLKLITESRLTDAFSKWSVKIN